MPSHRPSRPAGASSASARWPAPRRAFAAHLRFAGRTARVAFRAACLVALVVGVAEGAIHGRTVARAAAVRVPAPGAPTVVLVMRHAERAAEPGPDPALSEAGRARAERFAEAARDAQVTAVFATQFRRTRETAEPVARAAGVAVTERPVTPATAAGYADALAREIRERHAGRTVAVVGHGNTVPAVVAALAGRPVPALGEGDYGDVFVVVLPPGGGAARLLRLRAGA